MSEHTAKKWTQDEIDAYYLRQMEGARPMPRPSWETRDGGASIDTENAVNAMRARDPMYCPDYEVKGPYRLRKPRPALSIAIAFVTMAAILGFIVIPAIYFH